MGALMPAMAVAPASASPNVPGFEWTVQRAKAAHLVAEDRLSNDEIAKAIGVAAAKTVERWKQHPEFMARVAEIAQVRSQRLSQFRIAKDVDMMEDLQGEYELLEEVRTSFAADKDIRKLPGGQTGLVRRQFKPGGMDDKGNVKYIEVLDVDYGWGKARKDVREQGRKILGKDKGPEVGAAIAVTIQTVTVVKPATTDAQVIDVKPG